MVEVFKTNIKKKKEAEVLAKKLSSSFPLIKIDFDLEDCDKILRIEGKRFSSVKIIKLLHASGYFCRVLEY